MLIVNADDWGGWASATDAALAAFSAGRLTSVTAMVFMADSQRGADLAAGLGLDIGLHINFNQAFTGANCPPEVATAQERIGRFLGRSKYAQLVYNPWLRRDFDTVFRAQLGEFQRLYGRAPSHFDGHRHLHLCANMLLGGVIPAGEKVRRNFSFLPGEKSALNRAYRRWVDGRLARRFVVTDHFFALSQCLQGSKLARVTELARSASVELMVHPEKGPESAILMGEAFLAATRDLDLGTYARLS